MKNRTIITWALIATPFLVVGALALSSWQQTQMAKKLGTYDLNGEEVPLIGFQTQRKNNGPVTGSAIFPAGQDAAFGFDDFPYLVACNAVVARKPNVSVLGSWDDLDVLAIVALEHKKVALVIDSTKTSAEMFKIEDGACVPANGEGDA